MIKPEKIKLSIPDEVTQALERLESAGYEAWLVGGVRDTLLGKIPLDWDIATAAPPEQTAAIFRAEATNLSGMDFGTVCVRLGQVPIDITTYRREGAYRDHRHPENLTFTANFFEDCRRRDFTMNAVAYHPDRGVNDFFCGRRDMRKGLIRAIGTAEARFEEDAVRILRALRFSATLGFVPEEKTARALHLKKDLLRTLPAERILPEFTRMLCGKNIAFVLTEYADVLAVLIPEILPAIGFQQHSPFHQYDVWQHTVHAVAAAEPEALLRLTMLFHDLAKPLCFSRDGTGRGHFYAHPKKSAALAENVMARMKFPVRTREAVTKLVLAHDSHPRSRAEVRLLIASLGEENFRLLLKVIEADSLAHGKWVIKKRLEHLATLRDTAQSILAAGECLSLKSLALSGEDLLSAGFAGREVGAGLNFALDRVLRGIWKNERGVLLQNLLQAKENGIKPFGFSPNPKNVPKKDGNFPKNH